MKKLLILIIIIFVGAGIFYYENTYTCLQPITYDIGAFDARFNISKDKFLMTIKEAEAIWEKGVGMNLLNHQPGGKLKINLIFDEREAKTIAANRSHEQIEGTRESYEILLSQFKLLETSYKWDLSNYNRTVDQFKKTLDSYNLKVSMTNKKGGATPVEYDQLQKELQILEIQKATIDKNQLSLNKDAARLNTIGDELNQLAGNLNIDVDIHNQRFGTAREFEQGQYSGKIDIFQFDTISDLRLVIAHELGHALNIDHVENPKSVMYYLMQMQNTTNPTLSPEDIEAFTERCALKFSLF